MELDFRFKQYEINDLSVANEATEHKKVASMPYQEIIDYLENNKAYYYFGNFSRNFINIQGVVELNLSDGAKVVIGKRDNIMNVAIEYPDKTRFVGTWSNINDLDEFYQKCQNLE